MCGACSCERDMTFQNKDFLSALFLQELNILVKTKLFKELNIYENI